jgi:hypothetical protein
MMYHFCSMKLGFVVSRYLLGTLGGGREKNDKDDTGNVLLNLTCFCPSISWHKQWDLSLSGVVYVSHSVVCRQLLNTLQL